MIAGEYNRAVCERALVLGCAMHGSAARAKPALQIVVYLYEFNELFVNPSWRGTRCCRGHEVL